MDLPAAITLDRSSPVPLYFQMAEQIEGAIVGGRLAPGEKIDNEVEFAARLGLSRPTVRQAIQVLVDKGMLVRRRGVGTQVVEAKVRRSLELTSLYDDLVATGRTPRTRVLQLTKVEPNDEVTRELGVSPDEPVWFLERLRFIESRPLVLMTNYLPATLLELSAAELEKEGLYANLRRCGRHMRVARQRIGARAATEREAALLEETAGAPLLTMQRTAYGDDGLAIEFARHLYRPSLYSFETTVVSR